MKTSSRSMKYSLALVDHSIRRYVILMFWTSTMRLARLVCRASGKVEQRSIMGVGNVKPSFEAGCLVSNQRADDVYTSIRDKMMKPISCNVKAAKEREVLRLAGCKESMFMICVAPQTLQDLFPSVINDFLQKDDDTLILSACELCVINGTITLRHML